MKPPVRSQSFFAAGLVEFDHPAPALTVSRLIVQPVAPDAIDVLGGIEKRVENIALKHGHQQGLVLDPMVRDGVNTWPKIPS